MNFSLLRQRSLWLGMPANVTGGKLLLPIFSIELFYFYLRFRSTVPSQVNAMQSDTVPIWVGPGSVPRENAAPFAKATFRSLGAPLVESGRLFEGLLLLTMFFGLCRVVGIRQLQEARHVQRKRLFWNDDMNISAH